MVLFGGRGGDCMKHRGQGKSSEEEVVELRPKGGEGASSGRIEGKVLGGPRVARAKALR